MTKEMAYQPDTLMKDFWRKTVNFIDVCNGILFQGQNRILEAMELDCEQGYNNRKRKYPKKKRYA